jgi:hypothetical protein
MLLGLLSLPLVNQWEMAAMNLTEATGCGAMSNMAFNFFDDQKIKE